MKKLRFPILLTLLVTAATISIGAEEKSANAPSKMQNRLAGEKSPYLLQHKDNPVDWRPWGEAAFAEAREKNKPIFLSVGYSTCHWCHVMAHECFENPAIAKLMNELFINVKVDREERPDVDRVYMTYVQATTGSGGWPMSVFLTPDLKPFFGGTYFPPEDRYGRMGFPSILQRLGEAWAKDRENVQAAASSAIDALREHVSARAKPEGAGAAAVQAAFEQLARSFDDEWGGFGEAPKFPHPVSLNLLLRIYARERAAAGSGELSRDGKASLGVTLFTLDKMAAGGMYDHLGGGFHRYSVDRFWHVPHYEKMLYDQAQLTSAYLAAYQATRTPKYAEVARQTLDYVLRDMTAREGGFFSAEDADSLLEHGKPEHSEGAFYVWTRSDIIKLLGEEDAAVFNRFYGVEEDGNSPAGSDPHGELKGKNTLIQRMTIAEAGKLLQRSEEDVAAVLERSRRKLFDERGRRPRPHLDDKIITSWNGLMISAFARGAQVLGQKEYLTAAQRAAEFVTSKLMQADGTLLRSYRGGASDIKGFADDYATLIQGLLDLYEADFNVKWLELALKLQGRMDALFYDAEHGGYFSAGEGDPNILLRLKEDYDGAEPSPSSTAALNLQRLSQITNDENLQKRATATLGAFGEQLSRAPTAMPQMLCAVDAAQAKPRQVVIAGPVESEATRALLQEVHAVYMPNRILLLADNGAGQAWLGQRLAFIRDLAPLENKPTAFVCEDFVCKLPVTTPEELRKLLRGN